MELKYVIIDNVPIIFAGINHDQMKAHGNITSAGNIRMHNGKAHVFGKSHSLNIGPKPDDEIIINIFLGHKE